MSTRFDHQRRIARGKVLFFIIVSAVVFPLLFHAIVFLPASREIASSVIRASIWPICLGLMLLSIWKGNQANRKFLGIVLGIGACAGLYLLASPPANLSISYFWPSTFGWLIAATILLTIPDLRLFVESQKEKQKG